MFFFRISGHQSHPEAIISTGVSEVDDELEWFMVEGFEGQQDVVDQQVRVDLSHPGTKVDPEW